MTPHDDHWGYTGVWSPHCPACGERGELGMTVVEMDDPATVRPKPEPPTPHRRRTPCCAIEAYRYLAEHGL